MNKTVNIRIIVLCLQYVAMYENGQTSQVRQGSNEFKVTVTCIIALSMAASSKIGSLQGSH